MTKKKTKSPVPNGKKKVIKVKRSTDKRGKSAGTIKTQIKPGQVLNPKGRPKGSRNRLTEAFLNDMLEAWECPLTGGPHVIERVKATEPAVFLRTIASILPKELTINDGDGALDKLIEAMNESELVTFIAGIRSLGDQVARQEGSAKVDTSSPRSQPGSVH